MNMHSLRQLASAAVCVLFVCISASSQAEVSITLKTTFIQKYKNRATIDSNFIVDRSKGKPNPASKDGDMHVAGRDPTNIGMYAVAEIMNAKDHLDAVQAANDAQGTGNPIKVSGAWRIWNEHGGTNTTFTQGKPIAAATTSNPDHVFEVHPVSKLAGIDISASFKPIAGYPAKKPDDAFHRYEQVRSRIIPGNGAVTLVSNGVGYNYVDFQMVLNERLFNVDDGAFANASIQDLEGHLILRNKRMVFEEAHRPMKPPRTKVREIASRFLEFHGSTSPWWIGASVTVTTPESRCVGIFRMKSL